MQALSPDYCRRRLVQATERAERASDARVRAIHHELAHRYAELIRASEAAPSLASAPPPSA